MTVAVPEHWFLTTLSGVAELKGGLAKGKKRPTGEVLKNVPYLRVANVQAGFLDLNEVHSIEASESEIEKLALKRGDVLFNEGGDRDKLGRGWVWEGQIPECIHQNHVFRARPQAELIDPYFLSYWGNSPTAKEYFEGEGKQTVNLASISLSKLGELPVPLPSLAEQRRIVAKLEALLAKVDASRKRLERIPTILKRFRQAVLAAACEGRLTEDWREGNEKPGPESWGTKQMRELFLVRTGGTPSRKEMQYYEGGTIPWIKTGEVQNGKITSASEFITPKAVSESNAKIFPAGTILIALYGDGKTRGQVGRLTFPAATNQACAALISDSLPEITFQYVFNFWLSQYQRLRDESAGGNQQNLNLGIIKDWEISLPSEDEQAEIVRRTTNLLAIADQIEARYAKAKAQVDRLTQSILAKAFRGELVPQDPNDEPADVLLGRLAAAPAEASTPARRRGRPPRVQPAAPPVVAVAPAEDREAPALADLTLDAILQAHRDVLASIPSPRDEDQHLRAMALRLGFRRLGSRIKAHLRFALLQEGIRLS